MEMASFGFSNPARVLRCSISVAPGFHLQHLCCIRVTPTDQPQSLQQLKSRFYFKDRHGVSSNTFPPLDTEQNLALIRGSECNGETAIVFVRQLAGCQHDEDRTLSVRIQSHQYFLNLTLT